MRPKKKAGVYTSLVGDNGDLIARVAGLYLTRGMIVADVTYGKGVFWRKVDTKQFDFRPSDLLTCKKKYDFRKLPYKKGELDVVVLDPPYAHNPGAMIVDANYKNAATTKGKYHKDIIQLYREGMEEAFRVLKVGGQLWVKCKDEVESSYQRWSHLELYVIARELGFYGKDFFVMTQKSDPVIQHAVQNHARKNHSYLWVFKKPADRETRDLKKFSIP